MARNMYGATSADFTLTSGGRPIPNQTLTLWTARTGGTQITDLTDVYGVATTTVTSAADASITYYGPDNDKSVHWAQAPQGNRFAIRPVDITGEAGPGSGILTTKGDILARHTTADTRLGVGANGTVLVADSTQSTGLAWVTNGREWSGTGSPEGVVTAAPGSTWLQTDATTDVKGWIRWVKDYGIGNTGWVAGAEADTGHRNISASVVNGQVNDCRLRRYGNLVELTFGVSGYTNAAVAYTLPTGFRPSAGWMNSVTGTASVQTQVVARSGSGEVLFYGAGGAISGYATFLTFDPWPSSLPGSAA